MMYNNLFCQQINCLPSVLFQVKNSNHMEPEGLRRCLEQVLTQDGMDVSTLAIDCHLMIGKMLKDDYPEVRI